MHQKEINILRIFEALAKNENQSQRDIARKLKVSLGQVNALLKKLVQKGCFEISVISDGKIKYLLTAKGAAEKSQLTYQYVHHSLKLYKDIQEKFRRLFKVLKKEEKDRIVIYGKGELPLIAGKVMKEQGLTLINIIEDEKSLINLDYDAILILELEEHITISHSLKKMGIEKKRILTL